MSLSSDLISQFVKVTNDDPTPVENSVVYGTVAISDGKTYVRFDGSDLLTPVSQTSSVENGERVVVTIKNHEAIITGNLSSPSVRTARIDGEDGISSQITTMGTLIANKVSASDLEADYATINFATINQVTTNSLNANYASVSRLETAEGNITNLQTNKLDAESADILYAKIDFANIGDAAVENLTANQAFVNSLNATYASVTRLEAAEGNITNLQTNKLDASSADILYAQIDFANINMAAVQKLFADSGIIEDLVVSDGKITGELVGVTIKGDLIEGNTVVADKLVVMGSDGLYYKLNLDGVKLEAEQTEYNSLNGSVITAKSITATKIAVDDLVAFNATIGGFNLTSDAIFSGAKSSVNNTTRGLYMDRDGQFAIGDSKNYLKYYKNSNGVYKLEMSFGIGSRNYIRNSKTMIFDNYGLEGVEELVNNALVYEGQVLTYNGDTLYMGG